MRRLAPVLAVAVLVLRPAPAGAEPLDVDLAALGAPDPAVWARLVDRDPAAPAPEDYGSARGAKQRFAVLSSEMALALSSALLTPASTTGYAGFDFAFEGSYTPVHSDPVGPAGYAGTPWQGSDSPASVSMTGVHVRKALPFSVELGGRLTYLNRSSYFAAQGEAKWALNEGSDAIPDVAVRLAHTRLFGQAHWDLGATELDFIVSKRWGVSAVTSFTPYLAARYTFVGASSERIQFGDGAAAAESAEFPTLRVGFYRTTLGVRMTANVVSLAAEATYFAGKRYSGEDGAELDAGDYGDFTVPSAFSGAVKLGWEF